MRKKIFKKLHLLILLVFFLLPACSNATPAVFIPSKTVTKPMVAFTFLPTISPSLTPSITVSSSPTMTPLPSATSTPTEMPSPTPTSLGGGSGLLYYLQIEGTNNEGNIYALPASGGQPQQISSSPDVYWYFALSPDGKRIVYCHAPTLDASNTDIYILDASGGESSLLLSGVGFEIHWFPDGKYMLVNKEDAYYRVKADGSNMEKLSLGSEISFRSVNFPAISPDGEMIAFSGSKVTGSGQYIYVLSIGSSDPVQITNKEMSNLNATWSPDGSRLFYTSVNYDFSESLGVVKSDGTDQRILLKNAFGISWLNDTEILYLRFSSSRSNVAESVAKVNIDGTGQTDLITGRIYLAALSPDQRLIAYLGDCNSNYLCDLFVANVDGSNPIKISETLGYQLTLVWQP